MLSHKSSAIIFSISLISSLNICFSQNDNIQNAEDVGLRLDKFLVSQMPDHSRSRIQNWIRSGNILVNGLNRKTGYSLEPNDEIKVNPPKVVDQNSDLMPEQMDLNILFEDEEIVIINKPAGLVVHPGTGNRTGTLVNGLIDHFNSLSDLNGQTRPGIVHRLDADTSGLMVIAKTNRAHANLADQFQNRKIKKKYTALTWGLWTENSGEIDQPIARKKQDPTSYIVSIHGKSSLTKFEVEKKYRHLSKVSFFPKTGRTHQIRVHSAYLGFPIFGDEKYKFRNNHKAINKNLMLHSYQIRFMIKDKKYTYTALLPKYFRKLLITKRLKIPNF